MYQLLQPLQCGYRGTHDDDDGCRNVASGTADPTRRLMIGRGVAELVLTELVEFVSLSAAGEAQWGKHLGTDGAVAGRFLHTCVLEPLLIDGS